MSSRSAVLLLVTVAAAAASARAAASDVAVVNFDGPSAPPFFKFVVPGTGLGPALDYPGAALDGGVILTDSFFGNSATTDPNIYASCDTCTLGDGSGLPGVITAEFPTAVDAVRLDAINGTAAPATFTLTAFGAGGEVVASSSVPLSPYQTFGFVAPISVRGWGIVSITVSNDHEPGYTFAVDTLVITRCAADLDGSGDVGFADVLALLGDWGPCAGCAADLDGSGDVGFGDLLILLGAWGPC